MNFIKKCFLVILTIIDFISIVFTWKQDTKQIATVTNDLIIVDRKDIISKVEKIL